MDPRYLKLAENLVGYSVDVKKGERVLIDAYDVPEAMVIALVRAVRAKKGIPFVQLNSAQISRELLLEASEEQYGFQAEIELARMKGMQAYIALRGAQNIFESSDVPAKKMDLAMATMRPVQNFRVQETKWVVLRWPTPSMAQQALSSTESFEDFYFRVCTQDYARMLPGQRALKKALEKASTVEIKGPGTDLRFSLEGMGGIMCTGERNIPDGEVYTAPVRESVEGVITYNTPSVYRGISFDRIEFTFEKGKIVKATCAGQTKALNQILDSDEGARYIGEFAIGFNPHILHPIRDTLFDEKIAGSFHFTPGQAYEGTPGDNGNRSQVHWDIVNIQRPDYGGGQIYFDGKLVREDGIFLPKALQKLNPDYLLGEDGKKASSAGKSKSKAKKKSASKRKKK
ncbi:MAG: aminopeptidase [Opitutales bacterium]